MAVLLPQKHDVKSAKEYVRTIYLPHTKGVAMRFIYASLYVAMSFVAKTAKALYLCVAFAVTVMLIVEATFIREGANVVYDSLSPYINGFAVVPALWAVIGVVMASALAAALVVGLAKVVSIFCDSAASFFATRVEKAFAMPVVRVEVKPEPQLELPLPAVEPKLNRRVRFRNERIAPHAEH